MRDPLTHVKLFVRFPSVSLRYNQQVAKKRLPPEVKEFFVREGRKGGLIGGKARAGKLSAEERTESARRAARARWAKRKKSTD
jgi:hypothetical protein